MLVILLILTCIYLLVGTATATFMMNKHSQGDPSLDAGLAVASLFFWWLVLTIYAGYRIGEYLSRPKNH